MQRATSIGRVNRLASSLACVVLLAAAVAGCGDEGEPSGTPAGDAARVVEDPGPVHVHGLGVNPADGALFIATHTGLFRAPDGEQRATRVADRYQDTMGFTVIGPDRFLGSGHPDGREDLPPFLGLIRSTDAGESWEPVSLQGEVDFHVLEAAGQTVWGFGSNFDTREQLLLVSGDGGASWDERQAPEPLISLALDPGDAERAVAAGAQSLHATDDGGRTWTTLEGEPGLLAWSREAGLYRLGADGRVARSRDRGGSWREVGEVAGEPSAFEASGRELYAALHDGTVVRSADGGRSWAVRSAP